MIHNLFPRPVEGDCPEYYFRYTNLVPEVDMLTYLHTQRDWYGDWIEGLTMEQVSFRYQPDKWTLGEMIGHVLDTERVFAYRMLAISRGDKSPLPGFEQDDYVHHAIYDTLTAKELAAEWRAVRTATLLQTRSMDETMASQIGTANNQPVTAKALPYMICGHAIHHYNVARERYLDHTSG